MRFAESWLVAGAALGAASAKLPWRFCIAAHRPDVSPRVEISKDWKVTNLQ
jgi:hypothetical protein